MLAQTLCNLITANENLVQRLWDTYLGLREEQLILTYAASFLPGLYSLIHLLQPLIFRAGRSNQYS